MALANRWRQAKEELSAAISPDHEVLEDWALLAESCEKTQQWDEAIKYWKQLLQMSPTHETYRARLEKALVQNKRWDEVIPIVQKEFDVQPEDTKAWQGLTTVLVQSRKLEQYEATRQLIARSLLNNHIEHVERQIKACLLTPPSAELLEKLPIQQLSELLDSAIPPSEYKDWLDANRLKVSNSVALAKIRTGKPSEVEALIASSLVDQNSNGESRVMTLAIHALALAQQGSVALAHKRLDEFQQEICLVPHGAYESLCATILASEAQSLLSESKKSLK